MNIDKQPIEVSFKAMIRISLPLLLSQASDTIMMFTDRLFLSLLGKNHIAAAMSGGLTSFVFISFFLGIIGFANTLVAQYFGAKQHLNAYKTTSQTLWLSLLFYPLTFITLPVVYGFFQWAGHTPAQLGLEFGYFRVLIYGAIFGFTKCGLASYFTGIGKTSVVLISNLIGMALNIPFNYLFIFGGFGIPALGITGAAIGTLCGSACTCLYLGIAYALDMRKYRAANPTGPTWYWDKKIIAKLMRFGIPAGGELFITVFLFNFFLQLMYSYNENVAAAVTIAINYDMLSFVPLLGLSAAITTLVGQQMGAGSVAGAQKALRLGLKVVYGYGVFIVLLFVTAAPWLVRVFSMGFSADDKALIPLAETLLRLAAIYILGDATQLAFSGALRGAGDTRWVMYISVGLHIIMAAGTYLMIKVYHLSPITVWLFYIGFVLCFGACMLLRYATGNWKKIRVIEAEAAQ